MVRSRALGASLEDVVHTRMLVVDLERWGDAVGRAHAAAFGSARPASTMVEVSALSSPEMLVEIEAVALMADHGLRVRVRRTDA